MNLTGGALLKIVGFAALGAALGWPISFLIATDIHTARHDPPTALQVCMACGGLLGAAIATVYLIVRDSRDTTTAGATNFSLINGMGSRFIGCSDGRIDGSYLTTEWLCIAWLPIIPICNYRLLNSTVGRKPPNVLAGSVSFTIQGKYPVRLNDVVRGYSRTVIAGGTIAAVILVLHHRGI